jgi:hypothetical protein
MITPIFRNQNGVLRQISTSAQKIYGMCPGRNGDVYEACYSVGLRKLTGGIGTFSDVAGTSGNITGVGVGLLSGSVYYCIDNGSILYQAGGTGAFVDLSQTARHWQAMAGCRNGNMYAGVSSPGSSAIYMQTAEAGNFAAVGTTLGSWRGISPGLGNDMWAVNPNGVYKQTNGAGEFTLVVASGGLTLNTIAVAPNGDVIVAVDNGGIYVLRAGAGPLVQVSTVTKRWFGAAFTGSNLIIGVYNEYAYRVTNGF